MENKKIKIELDENMARTLGFIIDEIINTVEKEKKNKQECVKMIDKLEKLADKLDEKSEAFFEDENMCNLPNLYKLYNLWKQQEEFFDSVIRKNTK